MDKKKRLIFIDTNVFVIELRYKNDANFKTNRDFLHFIAKEGKGVTSIINILEVCGILSFNLNDRQLMELFHYLPDKFRVDVIPSHDIDASFPAPSVKDIMGLMRKKASLGDALIANVVNNSLPERTSFVSWDAAHFKDILVMEALTPKAYLARQ